MVEVKVVGWDQKCSFSMFGTLGQDSFGRFVAIYDAGEKFYFPDDAIIYTKSVAPPVSAPVPVAEPPVEESKPLEGKPSRAHEMAVLARKAREQREKQATKQKKSEKKEKPAALAPVKKAKKANKFPYDPDDSMHNIIED